MNSTEIDTTNNDNGESADVMADAHRELTQLSAYVVKSVLQTMAGNPMMAASLGPDFVSEATTVANRLGELLAIVNPEYRED